ncbi:hypothetical protein B0I73DRAFT_161959 [Yarrowia lipolytica]|uniref:YALI0C10538p n=1 Tax=Yarrowia lipolytica (strain CLIB 122 / E 150) TaxID=284591 RepID=Q6CCC9_YARLI|nr:YALI0C10538p [Yarrowia lipolytica CLIB122]KAE8172451.1 hypothetical protein BKA90DRAFT_152568 [Yarrowia lipolytica]KAJ8053302.1 hypothetical protein LXG23DRAFT_49558 [Yarrowia lipolytica]RDW36526.1 hypothetical protein B0I73DRAFT_161959 [Yarrowia lipolytica]RDW51470.1 hypothetical protein B0I75DRAFT_85807 [Yarrowia lipolytica]RMI94329.1 hypothetical protein BD777DRAFT_144097 [Yarrowia lipolytica]|eukprot:XP_501683.2 YALI0C10538p [Yarrowia lipolytica CLIB122]
MVEVILLPRGLQVSGRCEAVPGDHLVPGFLASQQRRLHSRRQQVVRPISGPSHCLHCAIHVSVGSAW